MNSFQKVLMGTASLLLAMTVSIPYATAKPAESHIALIHPGIMEAIQTTPDARLHVIVRKTSEAGNSVEDQATKLGAVITAKWDFINAFAAVVPANKMTELAKLPDVLLITQEQNVQSSHTSIVDSTSLTNAYNFAINADKAWDRGYNGTGITVAVVDSGIQPGTDFDNHISVNVKFNSTANYMTDKFGHGTHVAGIIAGDGSNSNGKYIGVASGVSLINVKFSDDEGKASERDLVDALQWVYENRLKHNIRVVNISSSIGTKQSYRESAVAAAVEQLWFAGVVVVVSAGNKGGELCSTCYAPANDPYVITVGATDDRGTPSISDDLAKSWSSSGLTQDLHSKPDIVAPGARIVSFMPNGNLRDTFPQNVVDNFYFQMGGTSMAAPVVSGVVAMMLQAHPEWTPDQVKWVLTNTTRSYLMQPIGTPGIVNAEAAVFYPSVPGNANQGLLRSPFIDGATGMISDLTLSWGNISWGNISWGNNCNY